MAASLFRSARRKSICAAISAMFSRRPVLRLSRPRTSCPCASTARASADPINPATPVMRTLAISAAQDIVGMNAARGIARVHHQPRLLDNTGVVVGGVVGDDEHAIVLL